MKETAGRTQDLNRRQRAVLAGLAEDHIASLQKLLKDPNVTDGMANSISDDIGDLRESVEILLEDDDGVQVMKSVKDGAPSVRSRLLDNAAHADEHTGTIEVSASLLEEAAAEIKRLEREGDGFAYVIHATNCQLCCPLNRPATICEHGKSLLESARPGATAGLKVVSYA